MASSAVRLRAYDTTLLGSDSTWPQGWDVRRMAQRRNVWALRLTMAIATAVIVVTLVRGSWILAVGLTVAALCWAIWQSARNRKLRDERDSSN